MTTGLTIGVSLKMYFGYDETLRWCTEVASIASEHDAVQDGLIEVFVLPSAPALCEAVDIFSSTRVGVGAQNLWTKDSGPFTGEISGPMLRDLGCSYAEVGHAERRSLFGETDELVAAKIEAADRNSLIPIVCVGEPVEGDPETAAELCIAELETVLGSSDRTQRRIIAYEPVWAIGQPEPASPRHISAVTSALAKWLEPMAPASRVIYGGSARLGLLSELSGAVDGMFLGRFAHDPVVFRSILNEAADVAAGR